MKMNAKSASFVTFLSFEGTEGLGEPIAVHGDHMMAEAFVEALKRADLALIEKRTALDEFAERWEKTNPPSLRDPIPKRSERKKGQTDDEFAAIKAAWVTERDAVGKRNHDRFVAHWDARCKAIDEKCIELFGRSVEDIPGLDRVSVREKRHYNIVSAPTDPTAESIAIAAD
jgi:hypothetical protein